MSTFGEELVESAREALDVASGKVEQEPFDPDSEPDRFTWNTGAGVTLIEEGDGPVLFTYEDIFGNDEPTHSSEMGNPPTPSGK